MRKKQFIVVFFSVVVAFFPLRSMAQDTAFSENTGIPVKDSDSIFWNREFHFGTTVFLDRRDLEFFRHEGHFQPGYSASYALKQIKKSGKGLILNFGVNTFGWKSTENDYVEYLGADQTPVVRSTDYSLFKYTFSHLAVGFYYRKPFPKFYLETDVSIGAQLLSFTRLRDIRKYYSGAIKNLRDEQYIRAHIVPSFEWNTRLTYRIAKRHLLFFNLKYIGFLDFDASDYYSFLAFNLGLSKDFQLTKRKPRNGKKFRDNYIYMEGMGIGGYYTVNYERNISQYQNFRFNLRAGYGYYEGSNIVAGCNLVLGHRIDRFELSFNYNYQLPDNAEVMHWVSSAVAYRAETLKHWLFRLSLGPAVKLQPEFHQFTVIFGASIGKKFGKK